MSAEKTPVVSVEASSVSLSGKSTKVGVDSRSSRTLSDPKIEAGIAGVTVIDDSHKKIGWKRTTILLCVEAIALGSLAIPYAFAAVGMILGVVLVVILGLIALYTAFLVGDVKIKYPDVQDYPQAVGRLFGKFGVGKVGFWVTSFMFVASLITLTGGHVLTGAIAFNKIVDYREVCALILSGGSAFLLFFGALPKNFKEFAFLGYIDCVSILAAIITTIVAVGIEAADAPGGLSAVKWSWGPPDDVHFYKVFSATTNIIFAYSFTICQYSMMDEMQTPKDYKKAISVLCGVETVLYLTIGVTLYALVGKDVKNPAPLSANHLMRRVAFGLALPVIFISGSINTVVAGKFVQDTIGKDRLKSSRTFWIALVFGLTVVAWVIAEAVPFFGDLLGLISSLFVSGFSFYFPALFWFFLLKEGKWNANRKNFFLSVVNSILFVMGLAILVIGTYSSAVDISTQYDQGDVRHPFSCNTNTTASS